MAEPNNEGENNSKKFPRIMIIMVPIQLMQALSQNILLSVKAIYMTAELGFKEDDAIVIHHINYLFHSIPQLTAAILADSKFGKWKIIVAGMILMRIPDVFFILAVLPGTSMRSIYFTAVILATFLNFYYPTLHAFYSEQFRVPDQEKLLKRYCNIMYWGKNVMSIIGSFSGSKLAALTCFGQTQCYFAPFTIWVSTESVVAIIIILLGKYFVKKPPTDNVILHSIKCVSRALYNKARFGKEEKRDRWIDYADDRFTDRFREDVVTFINLSKFFMLEIMHWALYNQIYSRFVHQGARLDPYVTTNFRVNPGDTMTINAVLVIVILPLLEYVVYPTCSKLKMLTTDLQKVCASEYLIATSFVAAAILEWQIRTHEIKPPSSGKAHLVIFNGVNQGINLSGDLIGKKRIEAFQSHIFKELPVFGSENIDVQVETTDGNKIYPVSIEEKKGVSYVVTEDVFDRINGYENYQINTKKSNGPMIRCVCMVPECGDLSLLTSEGKTVTTLSCKLPTSSEDYEVTKVGRFGTYKDQHKIGDKITIELHMHYTLILLNYTDTPVILFESDPHYLLPFWWVIPQIFILTLAEIMHYISWGVFIYIQSPPSMRSVAFAFDQLSRSLGDLLVAGAGLSPVLLQVYEFILFATLMYIVSVFFSLLAIKYKPHQSHE